MPQRAGSGKGKIHYCVALAPSGPSRPGSNQAVKKGYAAGRQLASSIKNILVDVLFSMVFTDSREVRLRGRKACRALIKRLTERPDHVETGHLDVQTAYAAGKSLLGQG